MVEQLTWLGFMMIAIVDVMGNGPAMPARIRCGLLSTHRQILLLPSCIPALRVLPRFELASRSFASSSPGCAEQRLYGHRGERTVDGRILKDVVSGKYERSPVVARRLSPGSMTQTQ